MANDNWEFLVDRIQTGKCALVIGPEIAFSDESSSFQEALNTHLSQKISGYHSYSEDDFLSFDDEGDKVMAYYQIRKFFEAERVPDLYEKLAEIPFHFVLSLSPDAYLNRAFERKGFQHNFAFYNKSRNETTSIPSPSGANPLIYNLLGSYENDESLVFTYDDLFDYIEQIYSNFKLPDTLKNILMETKDYIFIGSKFKKWSLRLLLRLMGLHKGKKLLSAYVDANTVNSSVKLFYANHFKINFVESNIREFIEELHQASKGIHRTPSKADPKLVIIECVRQNNFTQAFVHLNEAVIEQPDLQTQIIQVESIYNSYIMNATNLALSERELELNKVRTRILSLTALI